MISESARKELQKEETAAVFLHTAEIAVEGMQSLYFVDNTEAVVSGGTTYQPCAFTVVLPEQNEDGSVSPCRIIIDNTDRKIAELIKRALNKQIVCTISLIVAQTPDVIERGPLKFILRNITIQDTVSAELYDFYIYDRKIPEGVYNPQNFPGLF
ncbi:MAG: DUF1833 domain-containing protein [Treponemataceae bacterium]|nr:DUF1833 domain-containing protein [Treponemataceae bacterium]